MRSMGELAGSNAVSGDIFAVAERRLGWLDQRQQILAQNIANADTPGYQPRDLAPFARLLAGASLSPTQTNPLHLKGLSESGSITVAAPRQRAPDGNAVDTADQLTKIAANETDQALVGNLWKSYMGMYLDALGRGG